MGLRATVLAAVAVAGCAAKGDGLVITFDGADAATMGRDVTQLELFIGRDGPAAPDTRLARDYDPVRDQFAVEVGALEGYRLYLRADAVPTDLRAVAVVGYDGDPDAGGEAVVFGLVEDPPFSSGDLTEIGMTLEPVVPRGQANPGDRWIDRWGAAPIEQVAAHSCLAWGTGSANVVPGGQIVRADDLDCDGTVPPTCDEMQRDRTLLEGNPDVDGDGYGEWADTGCRACLVPGSDDAPLRPVRCDCDETDPAIHFAAAEICDGKDNDCDGLPGGNFEGPESIPCQIPGGVDCNMGVRTCTERNSVLMSGVCTGLAPSHVECLDLPMCETPTQCPIGRPGTGTGTAIYRCTQPLDLTRTPCGGGAISQLFPIGGTTMPATCSAVVWNGNAPGWAVSLVDGAGNHARKFFDVPCDSLSLVVEAVPAGNLAHTQVILVISDDGGAPIGALPIDIGLATSDAACAVGAALVCLPPT